METAELKKKVYLFKAPPDVEGDITIESQDKAQEGGVAPQSPLKEEGENSIKTRNNYDQDRFVAQIKTEDIEVELIPVLAFNYSNLPELWNLLKLPGNYSGMIFTSERCVKAVREALAVGFQAEKQWKDGIMADWASKYIYSVGPATSAALKTLFTPPLGEMLNIVSGEEANAESLADVILEVNATDALTLPLLYPCGSLKRDVLQKALADEKIEVSSCVVYETIKHPEIFSSIEKVSAELKDFQSFLVFFSPSGVKFAFEHLAVDALDADKCLFVAIGMTTMVALEEALASQSIQIPVVKCESPTPEALLEIVKTFNA